MRFSRLLSLFLVLLLVAALSPPAQAQDVITADGSKLTPATEAWIKNYTPAEDTLWRAQGGPAISDSNYFKRGLFERLLPRASAAIPWSGPGTVAKEMCHPYFPNGCWLVTRTDSGFSGNSPYGRSDIGWNELGADESFAGYHWPGLWKYRGTEFLYRDYGTVWGVGWNPAWHCGGGMPIPWGETLRSVETSTGLCYHLENPPELRWHGHPVQRGLTIKHVAEDIRFQADDPSVPNHTISTPPYQGSVWSTTMARYLHELPDPVEQRIIQWISSRLGSTPNPYDPGLAAEFRPHLRFDGAETYRPLDVERFFAERNDEGEPIHDVCWAGFPDAGCRPLVDTSSLAAGDFIDIAGDGNADNFHSPYNECTEEYRDCDTGPRSAIYYWQTPADPSHTHYVDYWFFYRYNDWPYALSFGSDHEGDWESVTLGQSPLDPHRFAFASFSQHGHWYSYLRENLQCDGGGIGSCGTGANPVAGSLDVFIASGSHANYPRDCQVTPQEPCSVRTDHPSLPEGNHNGIEVWGNNGVASALLPLDDPRVAGGWGAWEGKWGADGAADTPGHGANHDHFFAPWQSTCAIDNDGCATESNGASARARSTATRGNDRCGTWFGGDVVAAACVSRRLRAALAHGTVSGPGSVSLSFTGVSAARQGPRRTSGAGRGVSQAVGGPLRPGERMVIRSRRRERVDLFVRGTARQTLVEARFEGVAVRRRTALAAVVRIHGGRPTIELKRQGGRRIVPRSVRKFDLRRPARPKLLGVVTRSGEARLRLSARTRTVQLSFSRTRSGPAVVERTVSLRTPVHTARIRIPAEGRYVTLTAVDRRGVPSAPRLSRLK